MKIVISGYIGKKITGIGRNLICLLDNSSSKNEYVIYTNYDMKNDLVFKNPNVVVKYYNISKNNSFKNLLWTTFVFPFKVLKEKAEKALIPNFTLLLIKFKPTIVIINDLIEFNVPNKFSKKKMFYRTKLADPITARRANHIITVSENSKKDIMKYLKIGSEKISVVYNGVDRTLFKPMDKDKSTSILKSKKWPDNFILYAGTIDHPGKNAMGVIKAFEIMKLQNNYDGKLILAGMPGSGYEYIDEYISKSKFKRDIFLTGFVTDEELVALYSRCKVFCFLSLYEGFGISPLEALACGANVVVSNTSSLPEVIGKEGWQVNPLDCNEICYAIKSATNHINNAEINREEWLRQFKWDNLSAKFEKIIGSKDE